MVILGGVCAGGFTGRISGGAGSAICGAGAASNWIIAESNCVGAASGELARFASRVTAAEVLFQGARLAGDRVVLDCEGSCGAMFPALGR